MARQKGCAKRAVMHRVAMHPDQIPYLIISLSPRLIISLSPHLIISSSPHLLISLSHYLLISSSPHLIISSDHHLIRSSSRPCTLTRYPISSSHQIIISLSHHLIISSSPQYNRGRAPLKPLKSDQNTTGWYPPHTHLPSPPHTP